VVENFKGRIHRVKTHYQFENGVYVGIDLDGTTTVYKDFQKIRVENKVAWVYVNNDRESIVWFDNSSPVCL